MSETSKQTDNETATAEQIKYLLNQLTTAQQSFDEWRKTQSATFDKEMAAWFSVRDRQRFYTADEVAALERSRAGNLFAAGGR